MAVRAAVYRELCAVDITARSLARKTTASAISSAAAGRPAGPSGRQLFKTLTHRVGSFRAPMSGANHIYTNAARPIFSSPSLSQQINAATLDPYRLIPGAP